MQVFLNKVKAIRQFINDEARELIGNEAVSHFRASFRNQGFTNRSLARWKDVQRRTNPRDKSKAAAARPILTGTGELGNSIRFRKIEKGIEVYSDKTYAEVHNEGKRAGRGNGFKMPKRQFMGRSVQLDRRFAQAISQHLKKITR